MSERERRGPQGVQGVQGIEGIEGQGAPGVQGVQGEQGERGAALPRNVMLAFIAVVVLAFFITALFGWGLYEARKSSKENRRVIESLCDTTQTLDAALVVPFLIETNLLLKFTRDAEGRNRLLRQRNNLTIAHDELSSTQNCEGVR